ncbi:MAG: hypothetical protein MZV63_34555 [Marinilabiliales bacterium]|nr:hypothetical protein [Marinilabiliales bacterium]
MAWIVGLSDGDEVTASFGATTSLREPHRPRAGSGATGTTTLTTSSPTTAVREATTATARARDGPARVHLDSVRRPHRAGRRDQDLLGTRRHRVHR